MNRPAVSLAPLAVLATLTPAALAQNCGLRNDAHLNHGVVDGAEPHDLCFNTGWVGAGPLVSPISFANSNAAGCASSSAWTIESRFGYLHYAGSGHAIVCPTGGVGLSADWCASGGEPKAQFRDRITITSTTLPPGTPVVLRERLVVVGAGGYSSPSGASQFGADFHILNHHYTSGTETGTTTQQVGSTLDITGRLYCVQQDHSLGAGGTNGITSGTIFANVTARMSIEVLTPGATISSCSGHDYSIGSCPADLDDGSGRGIPEGAVDINDLLFFLVTFEAGTDAADLDNGSGTGTPDGGVDINDLLFFLVRFEAGC